MHGKNAFSVKNVKQFYFTKNICKVQRLYTVYFPFLINLQSFLIDKWARLSVSLPPFRAAMPAHRVLFRRYLRLRQCLRLRLRHQLPFANARMPLCPR